MKLFLRSPNWIGDCVMSLPAIRALSDLSPDIEMVLISKPHLRAVYKNIPGIVETVTLPTGRGIMGKFRFFRGLKRLNIREGLLFPNSFVSAFTMKLAGVKNLTGYSKDLRGWMLTRKKKFPGKNIHQIRSYMELAGLFLGKEIQEDYSNRLVFTGKELDEARRSLKERGVKPGEKLVGISPSAAYGPAKEWPEESFVEFIHRVSTMKKPPKFAVFGSGDDEEKIGRMSRMSSVPLIPVAGSYSLREAIAVISLCDVFVGNDSGLLHVADGAGVPSVGIFGPTSPGTTSPPSASTETVYKNADCSPCAHRECPIDHRCMRSIPASEISGKVVSILTGGDGS